MEEQLSNVHCGFSSALESPLERLETTKNERLEVTEYRRKFRIKSLEQVMEAEHSSAQEDHEVRIKSLGQVRI